MFGDRDDCAPCNVVRKQAFTFAAAPIADRAHAPQQNADSGATVPRSPIRNAQCRCKLRSASHAPLPERALRVICVHG
jgi:hypothetical protein